LRCPSEELVGQLAEGLVACGAAAMEEQGSELVTYLRLHDEEAVLVERVRRTLHAVLGAEPPDLGFEHVPEQDWLALWRAGLGPRRIGSRLVVAPSWSDVDAAAGDVVIRIDPQMAFGTGEHASTRGVLRLLEPIVQPADRLLDVGTGSGILAIAGARLGATSVLAVDDDPDAIMNAVENIAANAVAARVQLACAVVDDAFLGARGGGAFDGIVANVLSGVLVPLLPAFHRALTGGGWAILSGILVDEASGVAAAAGNAGFVVAAEDVEEQWWSVLLRRTAS
jgi:ribosomal protein L11 methyltransferase